MRRVRYILPLCFVLLFMTFSGKVSAGKTIFDSPYVSFSPDGKAWTTNAGDYNMQWYPQGWRIETGLTSQLAELRPGEHYYKKEKYGVASVGYWQVMWQAGQCIHGYHEPEYHQLQVGSIPCGRKHFSGWLAYCADCKEPVAHCYMYMNREAAESIDTIPLGMDYYYICPYCRNLEQGAPLTHECKAVSANRYRVIYEGNAAPGVTVCGLMEYSIHMYGNQTGYEGQEVKAQTRLSRNSYTCEGYRFVGWNTKADGSGTAFADEAEILNLTDENWNGEWEEESPGTIKLFAQWEPAESTLVIDPNGGSFEHHSGAVNITQKCHTNFNLDESLITSPPGYQIRFEANGGEAVAPVTGSMHFAEWSMVLPFAGSLQDNCYTFPPIHENMDTLVAQYEADRVELPTTKKDGYAFGGWYFDPECLQPAGTSLVPIKDTVLYADWVELVLEAEPNYEAHDGKGAVDLRWKPLSMEDVWYRLYQRSENTEWVTLRDDAGQSVVRDVHVEIEKTGKEEVYEVQDTGIYTIKLFGAQGGDYGEYSGGKGGMAEVQLWLEKGEKLYLNVGGKDGYHGGGRGTMFANGGGCTTITSDKKGLIAIAGGGGSASYVGAGGDGGSETAVKASGYEGESGGAGGGGGYHGGKSGELIYHSHSASQCGYHRHTGSSSYGGGCYRHLVAHVHSDSCPRHLVEYCGGMKWDGSRGWCPNCGVNEANGCTNCVRAGVCVSYEVYDCSNTSYYQLSCGLSEGYFCGKTDRDIESCKPAYGGSSYICDSVALGGIKTPGVMEGDGKIVIDSVKIGYLDGLELSGAAAPDLKAPFPIDEGSVRKSSAGEETIVISWAEPKDEGTAYYHKAEAFLDGEEQALCVSNITETPLCSGIAGYHVRVDTKEDTPVTRLDRFLEKAEVRVATEDVGKYLHVAAVDRAGNLGETVHILIDFKEVLWNVYTKCLKIQPSDNVANREDAGVWYVRCDGKSPVRLTHEAVMEGVPGLTYQLSDAIFKVCSEDENRTGKTILHVPPVSQLGEDVEYSANMLGFASEGDILLPRYAYTLVKRLQQGRLLTTIQDFLPGPELNGKALTITPEAKAEFTDGEVRKVQISSASMDAGNSLTIIGDAEGPDIHGMELLGDTTLIDGMGGSMHLTITADDSVSGVAALSLKIKNTDNGLVRDFTPKDGRIEIELSRQEPLFSGNFSVICTATDKVGNCSVKSYEMTEFDLETKVERALSPHDASFQRGESGWLHVRVRGYAQSLEVIFPEEWSKLDPTLNRVYDYQEELFYEQEETIRFMVPLYVPANKEYQITVKAYKQDVVLEDHPSVMTVQVSGSILDELRTRLR